MQLSKPLALGAEEDLPDPPVYFAPKGYATSESAVRQFAAVVTCTKFLSPKLTNLPTCLLGDHDEVCAPRAREGGGGGAGRGGAGG